MFVSLLLAAWQYLSAWDFPSGRTVAAGDRGVEGTERKHDQSKVQQKLRKNCLSKNATMATRGLGWVGEIEIMTSCPLIFDQRNQSNHSITFVCKHSCIEENYLVSF